MSAKLHFSQPSELSKLDSFDYSILSSSLRFPSTSPSTLPIYPVCTLLLSIGSYSFLKFLTEQSPASNDSTQKGTPISTTKYICPVLSYTCVPRTEFSAWNGMGAVQHRFNAISIYFFGIVLSTITDCIVNTLSVVSPQTTLSTIISTYTSFLAIKNTIDIRTWVTICPPRKIQILDFNWMRSINMPRGMLKRAIGSMVLKQIMLYWTDVRLQGGSFKGVSNVAGQSMVQQNPREMRTQVKRVHLWALVNM